MESFRNCGWPAFAALGMGSLAMVAGIVALALALIKPRVGIIVAVLAAAVSLGPAGIGFLGMLWGRQQVDSILASGVVDAESTERIRVAGYEEAAQCIPVGATISAVPVLLAGVALAVAFVRKKNEPNT